MGLLRVAAAVGGQIEQFAGGAGGRWQVPMGSLSAVDAGDEDALDDLLGPDVTVVPRNWADWLANKGSKRAWVLLNELRTYGFRHLPSRRGYGERTEQAGYRLVEDGEQGRQRTVRCCVSGTREW